MADEKSKAVADTAKRVEAETKDAAERQSYQPTPTQAENDRAKLGNDTLDDLDNKDDNGAPSEAEALAAAADADAKRLRSTSAASGTGYNTRASTPKK